MMHTPMKTYTTEFTSEYGPVEQSQQLIRGTWHGLLRLFLHLPALLFTAVILWIHYAKVYWFDENGLLDHSMTTANNILNALQLAAKLYELAVLASLADITLKTFKRRLIGNGLPVGILSGVYRVGDVFYLCSSRFWAAAPRVFWLAVFLITNTLLSVLVGPASAILIVPELGWYPLENAFSEIPLPIYLETPETFWPAVLEERLWANQTYCQRKQGTFILDCPAAGFAELFSWADGWSVADLSNSILFQNPSGKASRRLEMATDPSTGTFSTSPMLVTASTLGQLQSFIESAEMGAISETLKYRLATATKSSDDFYQPLVNSKCNVWNLERYDDKSEVPTIVFPSAELKCFAENEKDGCHRMREVFGNHWPLNGLWSLNETSVAYTIGTVADDDDSTLSSPIFAARLPFNNNGTLGMRYAACSFMAHWIPTTFAIDPTNSSLITTNITSVDIFTKHDGWRLATHGGNLDSMIRIDKSWLPFLDAGSHINGDTGVDDSEVRPVNNGSSSIGLLLAAVTARAFTENEPSSRIYILPGSGEDAMDEESDIRVAVLLEKMIGSLLADAISRTGTGHVASLAPPSDDEDSMKVISLSSRDGAFITELTLFENGDIVDQTGRLQREWMSRFPSLDDARKDLQSRVKLDFHAEQFGYGYGQAKETTRFALAVIYTYLAVLFLYFLVVQIVQANTVTAWADIQDIFNLAWSSSTPQELTNGTREVNKTFWKENVAIRVTSSRQTMLVVDDEHPKLLRLKRGEKYR